MSLVWPLEVPAVTAEKEGGRGSLNALLRISVGRNSTMPLLTESSLCLKRFVTATSSVGDTAKGGKRRSGAESVLSVAEAGGMKTSPLVTSRS